MILYSVLDLAPIVQGGAAAQSFRNTLDLARHAERWGYHRYWLAEHHNIAGIASAATSVVIGHVAGGTSRIRVGSGGIMLPNHAPLMIAEQFGTLEAMYPGRIDLGLGRAPGSDQKTMYALRRDPSSSESFPQDVLELQGYLNGETRVRGVDAIPGKGSRVPLYMLGSSTFGAQLAAALGLPYAFASHFAPASLKAAIEAYRDGFQPSEQLDRPYLIAGVNVAVADSSESARQQLQDIRRIRTAGLYALQRGVDAEDLTETEIDQLLESGFAAHVDQMLTYTAAGTPTEVSDYLDDFLRFTGADELITVHQAPSIEGRLRSVRLLADAVEGVTGASPDVEAGSVV
jgi:luciferase family oxidoreductase group 1